MTPEECMNPLLAGWLKEWMDEAKERSAKSHTVYKKAYSSVLSCPMRFSHPSEAQVLNGLGPKLCDRLAEKLKQHCERNGLPMPTKKRRGRNQLSGGLPSDTVPAERADGSSPVRKKRKAQPYVPKFRSGAYGLIVALGTLDRESNQAISKPDLINLAQEHCDSNYLVPSDTTKFYTAWKSMDTLVSKELVCIKGHPTKRYYLSDEGWEVADSIQASADGRPLKKLKQKKDAHSRKETASRSVTPEPAASRKKAPISTTSLSLSVTPEPAKPTTSKMQVIPGPSKESHPRNTVQVLDLASASEDEWPDSQPEVNNIHGGKARTDQRPTSASSSVEDTIILPPGSFEVKIVLDTREVRSVNDRDYLSEGLKKHGVTPLLRSLPLGDFLWVAEVNPLYADNLKAANVGEDVDGKVKVVLGHIVERKRLDDLIGSIKDGRFHEQKFRLHKSGVKNVTYLIEEHTVSQEKMDRYGDAVESAIASMQVVDHFFVKQTVKLDDTIAYLARMTKTLKGLYESKDIHVIPAQSFEAEAAKIMLERFRKTSPTRIFGMTFSVFNAMCDKSDSMTLRDVYLKMLMCVRGVTGDKAVEIQKNWPTPRALAEAYEGREKGSARDSMISDLLGSAIPRKKVAKTLSTKLAEIWA